jgi:hypothetical protein
MGRQSRIIKEINHMRKKKERERGKRKRWRRVEKGREG